MGIDEFIKEQTPTPINDIPPSFNHYIPPLPLPMFDHSKTSLLPSLPELPSLAGLPPIKMNFDFNDIPTFDTENVKQNNDFRIPFPSTSSNSNSNMNASFPAKLMLPPINGLGVNKSKEQQRVAV